MRAESPNFIVGAGLVGSLLSIFLAKRGLKSIVLERRPDMRREAISAGRSINLAISLRGLSALREVGLEEQALQQAVPMRGRVIHLPSGEVAFQPYSKDPGKCIYSISRGGLNQLLMTEAEKTGQVRIEFRRKVESLGELPIESPVFGTDGSASAIRAEILRAHGRPSREDTLDYGYKEILIPAGTGGSFLLEKNALHIWPRGSYMLIALPNFDGSFTCTLFLPFHGDMSFESLRTPEQVIEFFQTQFSDVLPLIPELTADFFGHPTGQMVTVKCEPWNLDGRALLVGDAAHAIVPFFGQGMNCGFEDVSILNQCLNRHGEDLAAAFAEFSRIRKPDADAIADLALENFVEMRDRVADARFQLERKVEKILEREFPEQYLSRYEMVTFSQMPYAKARQAGAIANSILGELCIGLHAPEEVDLTRARDLILSRFVPFFQNI